MENVKERRKVKTKPFDMENKSTAIKRKISRKQKEMKMDMTHRDTIK